MLSSPVDRHTANQIIINKALIQTQTDTVSWKEARITIVELLTIISKQNYIIAGSSETEMQKFRKWLTSFFN